VSAFRFAPLPLAFARRLQHRLMGGSLCLLGLGVLIVNDAEASDPGPAGQAERVSKLREEVDTLAQQLADRRQGLRDELTALRAEKADLERRLRLEQVRARTVAATRSRQDAQLTQLDSRQRRWLGPVKAAVARARTYVATSLPFMRKARLAALERIEDSLASARLDVGLVLQRLWRLIEQESAMTGEIQLAQQPIELGQRRVLADVARIGMALLYVRTPDGVYGWAEQTDEGWSFEAIEGEAGREAVAAFFAALDDNRALGPRRLLLPPLARVPRQAKQTLYLTANEAAEQ
jgi:hypothetical protein